MRKPMEKVYADEEQTLWRKVKDGSSYWYLKLASEKGRMRLIGREIYGVLHAYREYNEHCFHKGGDKWGFAQCFMEQCNPYSIYIHETGKKGYNWRTLFIDRDEWKDVGRTGKQLREEDKKGTYLHFKDKGFELQYFIPYGAFKVVSFEKAEV
jgi:hypothetical protein